MKLSSTLFFQKNILQSSLSAIIGWYVRMGRVVERGERGDRELGGNVGGLAGDEREGAC